MIDEIKPPKPRPEPLFRLELGENGGTLAPISVDEIVQWIEAERAFWAWLIQENFGSHDATVRSALRQLDEALRSANESRAYPPEHTQHGAALQTCKTFIRQAFIDQRLPHSSTPRAKRIDAFRTEAGNRAASFFAAVFVPPPPGHYFQVADLDAWRGMLEGIIDRYQLTEKVDQRRLRAAEESFEQLRAKIEQLYAAKTAVFDDLHRNYGRVAEAIQTAAEQQARDFAADQASRVEEFFKLSKQHGEEMEHLRRKFREEIALRAPATYWENKRKKHLVWSWITGILTFVAIFAGASFFAVEVQSLMRTSAAGQTAEVWRLAALGLIGGFVVWAIRLLARMFLSHLHLLTDAGERIVMVQTYLALLEGDRLASKEDRQLILQALFRPAADGIVKDEGVPVSYLELLTRQPK